MILSSLYPCLVHAAVARHDQFGWLMMPFISVSTPPPKKNVDLTWPNDSETLDRQPPARHTHQPLSFSWLHTTTASTKSKAVTCSQNAVSPSTAAVVLPIYCFLRHLFDVFLVFFDMFCGVQGWLPTMRSAEGLCRGPTKALMRLLGISRNVPRSLGD